MMERTSILVLLAAFAAILFSGCAQQSQPPSRFNQTEGQMCGGFAGFICADGYYCQYSNGTQPSYPDEAGSCVRCPMYSSPSPAYISDCEAKGGNMTAAQDERGCLGPARCTVE
ncbi:Uncharacterised protein [uncultured archaeon]|nr:Uncharacterised protein [uncultured archaeon]